MVVALVMFGVRSNMRNYAECISFSWLVFIFACFFIQCPYTDMFIKLYLSVKVPNFNFSKTLSNC